MVKISVIGICGNSAFLTVDHFHQKGETLSASSLFEEYGGKGMNQAVAAARFGAKVSFLAAVGDDADAENIKTVLEQDNLSHYLIKKPYEKTTRAVILTDSNGENQVTVYRGACLCADDVSLFEKEISESDVLLLQHEVPDEVNKKAVEIAKKHNTKVILNPAPITDISDAIADYVFAVTPNEQESISIRGNRFQNVIKTIGSKGCIINGETTIPSPCVKAIDTTGAGDTFNGILAVMVAENNPLEVACRYATVGAALSVTKPYVLNAIPNRIEIENFIKKEKI